MASPNDGVAFPVTNRLAGFNLGRSIVNRTPVRDLAAPVSAAGITFPLFLLTAQAAPKVTASGFVSVDILIKRFVANRHHAGNLFRAPLLAQEVGCDLKGLSSHLRRIARTFRTAICQKLSLIGAIAPLARIAVQFPADRRTMPVQDQGNLGLVKACFHQGVNLITFRWAEVFVGHGNFDWGVKKL